jgi:hypothetical protein
MGTVYSVHPKIMMRLVDQLEDEDQRYDKDISRVDNGL